MSTINNDSKGIPYEDLPPTVLDLIRKGDSYKIAAIKELRTLRPGLGLAEAKKIVEETGLKLGTMTVRKSGCFIATACYGDYNHPVVMELRCFRDAFLEQSSLGNIFIEWYYQWSPPVASYIADCKILQFLTRLLVVTPTLVIVRGISQMRKYSQRNMDMTI